MMLDTFDQEVEREMHDPHHKGVPGHHGAHHVVQLGPTNADGAGTNLMLDAFDTNLPISGNSSKRASRASLKSPVPEWQKDLPSEEEQLRMLNEMNGWSTVENKKTKKKSAGDKSGNESSGNEAHGLKGAFAKIKASVTHHKQPDYVET